MHFPENFKLRVWHFVTAVLVASPLTTIVFCGLANLTSHDVAMSAHWKDWPDAFLSQWLLCLWPCFVSLVALSLLRREHLNYSRLAAFFGGFVWFGLGLLFVPFAYRLMSHEYKDWDDARLVVALALVPMAWSLGLMVWALLAKHSKLDAP